MTRDLAFDIASLHGAYAAGLSPQDMCREVLRRIEAAGDPGIFISLRGLDDLLAEAAALGPFDPEAKPLWGVPFAVKDNIDVEGMETTAGCPAFAYEASSDAVCVAALRSAGAIAIGKTNLDQFATGLVGVRSPYPPPRNPIDDNLIPGGSSSGSAVAVARGIVSFALGTDTAGSGRVPAALNNIVGLKPSLGAISATGVVPACRTLDTVSIFALNVDDAYAAFRAAAIYDPGDPFARAFALGPMGPRPPRVRIGIPSVRSREFFGDEMQAAAFAAALDDIASLGGQFHELDFAPFYEVARLLYQGPWVAERYTVIEDLLARDADAVYPVTRQVISMANGISAADTFRAMYRLTELRSRIEAMLAPVDVLCVPSMPTFYTVADLAADPITPHNRLGTYTNFVNLLDLCGTAVPARGRKDGLPGSVTILAKAGRDGEVASIVRALHHAVGVSAGATGWALPQPVVVEHRAGPEEIELAVVGAHMSGLPLNGELTRLGARFLRTARTAPDYRLYALAGGPPARPGMVRSGDGGAIELETWALPKARFGDFIAGIPQPLGIGTVTLETGERVKGFLCESAGLEEATDITRHGGWRAYVAVKAEPTPA